MDTLMKSDDNIFWVERRRNFVKLCFGFTPELDEDLNQVDFIYTKIAEKIMLGDYKIFSISEERGKRKITLKPSLEVDGFMQVLIPMAQEITADKIELLLAENKCNFNQIHKNFYTSLLLDVQKCLTGSIIITHSLATHCTEFSSCPIVDVDLYNISAYCVDIYGDAIENVDWEIEQK